MKLLSVKVENYRIHRSVEVAFDEQRTLLGGPNESGKSTLIEAIHRAFFLRYSTGGAIQQGMVSTSHGGIPSIEAAFEVDGINYTIRKEFGGSAKGRATLKTQDGRSLANDDAEEKLAELLGTGGAEGGGGKAEERLRQRWAHLWIWQGSSTENPSDEIGESAGDLIAQLQQIGGAVAAQSGVDAAVASAIAQEFAHNFTATTGNVKAGSRLAASTAKLEEAKASVEQGRSQLESVRGLMETIVRSEADIKRHTAALLSVQAEKREMGAKQRQVELLTQELKTLQSNFDSAKAGLSQAEQNEAKITQLRQEANALQARIRPVQVELTGIEASVANARAVRKASSQKVEETRSRVDKLRERKDLAGAWLDRLQAEASIQKLRGTLQQIEAAEQEIKRLEKDLARLPAIGPKELQKLRKLQDKVSEAEATLKAISTGIELIAADGPVKIDGLELSQGERKTVDESVELSIGDHTRLRIIPGGGTSLADAREGMVVARQKLEQELRKHDLITMDEATALSTRRETLLAKLEQENVRLDALSADSTRSECSRLENEMEAASGRIDILNRQIDDFAVPKDVDSAHARVTSIDEKLRTEDPALRNLVSESSRLAANVEELESILTEKNKAITDLLKDSASKATRLTTLLSEYGTDEERATKREQAEKAHATASVDLTTCKQRLDELNPAQLERDAERLERALDTNQKGMRNAESDLLTARGSLNSEALGDPEANLSSAEARLQSAQTAHARESLAADAIKLLHETFKHEQQALSAQLTRPLAEKITVYLQCLFGKDARAEVSYENGKFSSIQLVRSTATGIFKFEELSGGTREQLAAAIRLAMAEILAKGHGGCLPVVFDDAFAYSDPVRVQELQRMLDLAATNGLQVIVLSCNPADYAKLGAREIRMGVSRN